MTERTPKQRLKDQTIIVNKSSLFRLVKRWRPHQVLAVRSYGTTAVLEDAFVDPALSSVSKRVVPHESDSSVFSTKVIVILEVFGDVRRRSTSPNGGSKVGALGERRSGDRDGEEGDGRDDGSGELHTGRVRGAFERGLAKVDKTVLSRVTWD